MLGTLLANRYRIDARLGEGGMGVVYKAQDTLLDRVVAIKTLSPRLVGEDGLRRLLREAQSAAKLNHPNIVAIHDVIEESDARLIVMEYVPGQTLQARLPLKWPDVVEIGLQVCAALAYAHAEGVIHRDIKPENILLTAEGMAKVMDFGLARSEGRSRLTQTGMVVGTVTYIAPEQALQGAATPRSDLYSLGCVLYEAITGRPPFEAEDPIAVITQHINIPPVAPRFYAPDIPPALESIILRLLAKDPDERFPAATEVMPALDAVRSGALVSAPSGQEKITGGELVQAVRRGALVGREAEVRTLKSLVDQAAAGAGRVALVGGQVGVGKTRLVEEAITYAHLRGVRVLSGKCYEGATPYEPIARMLRDYLRIADAGAMQQALGDYAADLARLAPEVRQKLGTVPESIPLPAEQERARLFEAVTRLFSTLSQAAPVLLSLDDLHLADGATLQLLRYFAPAVARERILLICTYQPEDVGRTPALVEVLRQWPRERWAVTLEVKPLPRAQVAVLIQAMAKHPRLPVSFAGRIYEVTEGNPYFIEEVINALFEAGTLYIKDGEWSTDFDEGARYAEMPVPPTVRAAIEARLERLPEGSRSVLVQAAVLGRRFSLSELAPLTGMTEDTLLDVLDQVLAARLLREVRVGTEDRYEFTQSMVREALYEGISRHRRRRMHLKAAEALEQATAGRRERAGEIADHFLEAGEEERVVPHLIAAGEEAERVFAHEEAIRRLEAARELLEDAGQTSESIRILEMLGEPYLNAGLPEKAVAAYERVLDVAQAHGDRKKVADLRRKIGRVHHLTWNLAQAIPILEQALKELGEEDTRDALMLYLDLARAYLFGGDPGRAIEWGEKALRLAQSLGAVEETAVALVEIGTGYQFLRDVEPAERYLNEAARLGRRAKGFRGKWALRRAINNLGSLAWQRGDVKAARDGMAESLRIAEEAAMTPQIAFGLSMVGGCDFDLGDWPAGRKLWETAAALGERGGALARFAGAFLPLVDEDWEEATSRLEQHRAESQARGDAQFAITDLQFLARVALWKGANREAEEYARRCLEVGPLAFEASTLIPLAEALARQGRADEAAAVCDEAEQVVTTIKGTGVRADVHQVRGLILAHAGDREAAAGHFHAAIEILHRYPRPYLQARILEDLARCYREGDDGDRQKVLDAYRQALDIYERVGAGKSAARVRVVMEEHRPV